MRPTGSGNTSSTSAANAQRAWEPPALTKLAIGTETKSSGDNKPGTQLESAGGDKLAQPSAEAAPATKLGFSFEWAFPLSARTEL